ncbi:MAG TPA: elongation factor G [Desulfobacterales bacterium]|nr:elongation factor G [Desulfobacterales bacterium]
MKEARLIRNVGIFGHSKCGKTSLAEAILYTCGKNSRLGKVDDGSALMDFEPEEINHKLSINSSFNRCSWKKHDIFLTDTPGDDNFLNDAFFAAQVVDSAVFIVGAVLGIKNQTAKIADFIFDNQRPALIFINKMDRERADFNAAVNGIKNNLPFKTAVLQIPVGAEDNFRGVINLLSSKAFLKDENGEFTEAEIPADMTEETAVWREALMESVAETDDDLIEKFLEEGTLKDSEIQEGLRRAVREAKLCPVLAGSAVSMGVQPLLDTITDLLPAPAEMPPRIATVPGSGDIVELQPTADAPFSALVFKTMADPYAGRLTIFKVISGKLSGDTFYNANKAKNEKFGQLLIMEGKEHQPVQEVEAGMIAAVTKLKHTETGDTLCLAERPVIFEMPEALRPTVTYAVSGTKKDDEDKLFAAISKMLAEDPTLRLGREKQTNEVLISGTGKIHLQITGEKIQRKFGVGMELKLPKVPYKETIRGKAKVQYKHKKQSGGRGQYADNWLQIEPLPRGGGYEFVDEIVGGVIPKQYIPAVNKGVQEAIAKGVIAGYPMVDVKVSLVDGSFHNVDSSEMAFKISGSMAFKKGALEANPVLLEPIMNLTITVPKDYVGDVIGDINSRRGRVMGMDSAPNGEIIKVQAPMAEIQEYGSQLIAITGGLGSFMNEFSHYEELPAQLTDKIINKET